jgi:hypothetical protein
MKVRVYVQIVEKCYLRGLITAQQVLQFLGFHGSQLVVEELCGQVVYTS